VPLAQADVDRFLAASKRVPREGRRGARSAIVWQPSSRDAVMWRAPVEAEGIIMGSCMVLIVVPSQTREWSFILRYANEDVLRWDFESYEGPTPRHSNPKHCPRPEFTGKIRAHEHEHRYVEGLDLKCAVELCRVAEVSHREALTTFCHRANISFSPDYQGPATGEQLSLGGLE
jgi:hypothetical protein